jgi:hypothetical protein
MDALGQYDADLEMFVEPKHNLDAEMLRFLRWLMETHRLDGDGVIENLEQ